MIKWTWENVFTVTVRFKTFLKRFLQMPRNPVVVSMPSQKRQSGLTIFFPVCISSPPYLVSYNKIPLLQPAIVASVLLDSAKYCDGDWSPHCYMQCIVSGIAISRLDCTSQVCM